MTMSKPAKTSWIDISIREGEEGREDQQYGWQSYVGKFFCGVTILDVGAGLGQSRWRLEAGENRATLQDLAPGLPVDIRLPVDQIETGAFDVVTAFDVIEHVAADLPFFDHLCRIARHHVFISTPNNDISGARNRHHVREYSPAEMIVLAGKTPDVRRVHYFAGDARGERISELTLAEFGRHNLPHHAILIDLSK